MRAIDYFDRGVDIDPDRLALVEGDKKLTFRELQTLTFQFA